LGSRQIANRKIFMEPKAGKPASDAFELARAAGLDLAVMQFPEDVAVAAETAARAHAALCAPDNIMAEPWPPMRMRSAT
jgi:hypothetical protein